MTQPRHPRSREVQVRVLGTLLHGPSISTDQWEYGVADSWLCTLKESLDLQSTGHNIPPMPCSFNDSENSFLGESVWKILVSWYGLCDDHELHRRPSVSKYMQIPGKTDTYILADKNLDFIFISMCFLDHIDRTEKQLYQQVFFWEEFNFLQVHLHRALRIPLDRNLRMWTLIKLRDEEQFLGPLDVSEDGRSFGSFLCSKLPGLLEKMTKRQELPPPTAPAQYSFSSCKSHLSELLHELEISITLCVEDIGRREAGFQNQQVLTGLNQALLVSKNQDQWTQHLNELLDNFEKEVQFTTKTKRDELQSDVLALVKDKVSVAENLMQEAEAAKKEISMRENRFKEREKDLDEREHDLNTKVDKFKRGLTDYLLQRKKLEAELKRIEEQNKFSDSKVELNVGGVRYTTSTITLTKESESLLGLMFSGRHHLQKGSDGSYFIDRDGTNFRYILNYLRDVSRAADNMPSSLAVLNELLVEAEYYQLTSLVACIRQKLSSQNSGPYTSLPLPH